MEIEKLLGLAAIHALAEVRIFIATDGSASVNLRAFRSQGWECNNGSNMTEALSRALKRYIGFTEPPPSDDVDFRDLLS